MIKAASAPTPHKRGSIPARGPIGDEFLSTVPGYNFNMCMIPTLDLYNVTVFYYYLINFVRNEVNLY